MGLFLFLCGMAAIKWLSVFGKNLEELYRKIFKKIVMFLEVLCFIGSHPSREPPPHRIWCTSSESCSPLSLPAPVCCALWLPAAVLLHVHVFVSVCHSYFHFLLCFASYSFFFLFCFLLHFAVIIPVFFKLGLFSLFLQSLLPHCILLFCSLSLAVQDP